MTNSERAQKYVDYCMDEANVVSSWIRKNVQMYLSDVEKIDDPDFPYYFDEEAADDVINFFGHLKLSKGSSAFFKLLDWQVFVLWCAYGWKKKENGQRRYKRIYIKVARKNGKTEFLCGIGIYGQFLDTYFKDSEVYWFATKKDQAFKGFERQQEMTRNLTGHSAGFAAIARVMAFRIVGRKDMSFTAYLGQDSKGEDGAIPAYGLCDEWHAHETNRMMQVVESGMVGRDSPMTWAITTAGYNVDGPCAQFEKKCKQGLNGLVDLGGVLPFIYDLDDGDNWEDEKNWAKPNPSLDQSTGAVTMEGLREAYKAIKTDGVAKRMDFQTKNLNMWLKANSEWISADIWKRCRGAESVEELRESLKGRLCFGGMDLAPVTDLSSLTLCFPPENEDEPIKFLKWLWCPYDKALIRAELDAVPYFDWYENGYMELTPGNVTDYNFIQAKIEEVCELYQVHSIGFDPYSGTELVTNLINQGIPMEKYTQTQPNMSPAIKGFEREVLKFGIAHGGDPALAWCVSNVVIKNYPNGNVMMDKDKSPEKIDAAVSTVMAYGQYQEHLDETGDTVLSAVM